MILLLVFWLIGIADITATAFLISAQIASEYNPILLWVYVQSGLIGMIIFKVSVHTLLLGFIGYFVYKKWISKKVCGRYLLAGLTIYLLLVLPAYALVLLR